MKLTIEDIKNATRGLCPMMPDGAWLDVMFDYDLDNGPPWEDTDFYDGLVRIVSYDYRGQIRKRAGEVILHADGHRAHLFDMRAATKRHRHPTITREEAAKRAQRDADWLGRWLRDDWHYCAVVVCIVTPDGDRDTFRDVLGRVECAYPEKYHLQYALDMAQGLVDRYLAEIGERAHWEARDVETK